MYIINNLQLSRSTIKISRELLQTMNKQECADFIPNPFMVISLF